MARGTHFDKRLRIEPLEKRLMLDGNVTATVVDGDLIIRGDDSDNAVEIMPGDMAGQYLVVGLETTINGRDETAVLDGVTGDFSIEVHNGDDLVRLVGRPAGAQDGLTEAVPLLVPGNLIIDSYSAGRFQIFIGDETASVEIGGYLGLRGFGTIDVSIQGTTLGGWLHISGFGSTDTIRITDTWVGDKVSIDLQEGNDWLEVHGLTVEGGFYAAGDVGDDTILIAPLLSPGQTSGFGLKARSAVIETDSFFPSLDPYDGEDYLQLQGLEIGDSLRVQLGGMDDILNAVGNVVGRRTQLHGGDGIDTINEGWEELNDFSGLTVEGFELSADVPDPPTAPVPPEPVPEPEPGPPGLSGDLLTLHREYRAFVDAGGRPEDFVSGPPGGYPEGYPVTYHVEGDRVLLELDCSPRRYALIAQLEPLGFEFTGISAFMMQGFLPLENLEQAGAIFAEAGASVYVVEMSDRLTFTPHRPYDDIWNVTVDLMSIYMEYQRFVVGGGQPDQFVSERAADFHFDGDRILVKAFGLYVDGFPEMLDAFGITPISTDSARGEKVYFYLPLDKLEEIARTREGDGAFFAPIAAVPEAPPSPPRRPTPVEPPVTIPPQDPVEPPRLTPVEPPVTIPPQDPVEPVNPEPPPSLPGGPLIPPPSIPVRPVMPIVWPAPIEPMPISGPGWTVKLHPVISDEILTAVAHEIVRVRHSDSRLGSQDADDDGENRENLIRWQWMMFDS